MPQPLSRVVPQASIDISSGSINRRPELALEALKVIAFWAGIEGDLATILAAMLKSDVATGVAMYEALTGSEGRRAALLAAARQALPEWLYILFEAVQIATKPSRNQRNAFAHGIWATCAELPDAILSLNPSSWTKVMVSHRQVRNVDGANVIRPTFLDQSTVLVYRKGDMARAKSDAVKALGWHEMIYTVIIDDRRGLTQGPVLGLLLQEPQIQQAIAKMAKQNGKQIPPELRPREVL